MSIKVTDRADKRNLICAQLFLRKGENKWDKGKKKKHCRVCLVLGRELGGEMLVLKVGGPGSHCPAA